MKSLIRTEGQSSQIANINLEGGRRENNVGEVRTSSQRPSLNTGFSYFLHFNFQLIYIC